VAGPVSVNSGFGLADLFSIGKGTQVDWVNGRVTNDNRLALPFAGLNTGAAEQFRFPGLNDIFSMFSRPANRAV
jgi:hypothetical protein